MTKLNMPAESHSRLERWSAAPVAQVDRVSASEAEGHRFKSCRARHPSTRLSPVRELAECVLGFPQQKHRQ